MKRRIKVLAVIMAAVLMVSGAGSTLYENGVKADAKDTLKWNSAITKVKVKKRVALTVNVGASKVQWSVAGKNAATADLASANAYASVDHNGVVTGKKIGNATIVAVYQGQKIKRKLHIAGKKKIALDAGHQSRGDSRKEPVGPGSSVRKARVAGGATGVASRVPEYKFTLSVAKRLQKELKKRGYEVYMVRTKNNVNISNKKRAMLANKSGADIYIRIHGDSSGSRGVKGASIFYPSARNHYVSRLSRSSKRLSKKLLNAYCKKTGIKKRGCSGRDDLTGTNWSKIPVTLIECGFLSNPSEDRKLQNKSFQKKMAVGMANGVDAYFGY